LSLGQHDMLPPVTFLILLLTLLRRAVQGGLLIGLAFAAALALGLLLRMAVGVGVDQAAEFIEPEILAIHCPLVAVL